MKRQLSLFVSLAALLILSACGKQYAVPRTDSPPASQVAPSASGTPAASETTAGGDKSPGK